MIKVKSFKKLKGGKKKYEITFEKNGKTYVRKFGAQGMSDFTIHKDRERRERYISRHKKDLRTGDPMKPGYLSMYILWNKPSLKASLADYKRRLSVYNRTGKFPKGITGSKKMSFGTTDIPFEQTSMNILPDDIQNLIRDTTGARIIQDASKKYNPKRSLIEALKIRGLKRYQDAAKRTSNPRENSDFINRLWTNLDPVNDFTAKWLKRAGKVLVKSDFDFKTRNFWWKVVQNQLLSMHEIEEELGDPSEELPENEYNNYEKCQDAIMQILNKTGYPITIDDIDEGWAWQALMWWNNKRTNTFGKKKTLFGMTRTEEIKDILADKVRWDPAQLILEYANAPELQKLARGYLARKFTKSKKYLKMVLLAINIDFYNSNRRSMGSNFNPEQYAIEQMTPDSGEPWLALNPLKHDTAFLLKKMSSILTKKDLSDDMLWYNIISYILDEIVTLDPDNIQYRGQQAINVEQSADYTLELLNKMGYPYGPGDDLYEWYNNALAWLEEQATPGLNFGKKYQAPDNVVNKKMYESIKSKIQRSIKGRRWGAYDSGRLVREYKANGGTYRGSKGKTNLSRWYKEKWVDACAWPKRKPCGRKTKSSITYCRPSKRVDSKTPKLVQKLTKSQIKARCAKKKKNPMKRVTKFGRTTPDETVAWGDGAWVIHCNYYPWGAHSTIRYKPLAEKPDDYSYHYGIYNDGTLRLWATGEARNTPIPQGLRTILVNYYNTRCKGNMSFGKNQELLDKMRKQMFKQLMSYSDVNSGIQNTIIKRCKRGFLDSFCQDIFTQMLLSMYFTVASKSKMTPARQNNIKQMESFIPANFKPTMLNITKKHFSKIDEILYLLQDHTYGNFKNARIASLLYEYIHQK